MKNSLSLKILRINYYICALIIAFSILISYPKTNLYMEDYIFICILILSYIIIEKLALNLKDIFISFGDYIIIISYFIFNIKILIIILLLANLTIFTIDNITSNDANSSLFFNSHFFNISVIIISVFLSYTSFEFMKSFFNTNFELVTSIFIFAVIFLIFNYILVFIDQIISKSSIKDISTNKALSYFMFSFILSLITSYISLYLYNILQYTLVLLFTMFLIFISFNLNKVFQYRKENMDLININNCYHKILSKSNYNNKLYAVIDTIEKILPFYYCGIYHFIDKHEYVYPLSHKNETSMDLDSLRLENLNKNKFLNVIQSGNPLYTKDLSILNSFNLCLNNNFINNILILPINNSESTMGCIFIGLKQYKNIDKEIQFLTSLTSNLSLITENMVNFIKERTKCFLSYNEFLEHLDFNINNKLCFTLAIIEIKNYSDIINKFNMELYETLKKDIAKTMEPMLSSYDSILYYEKEDIFILFDLQDSLNAKEKLKDIEEYFKGYKFNGEIKTEIIYALSEYPMDGISKEDIITKTYKNLYKIKEHL